MTRWTLSLRYSFALACFGVLACFVPCAFAQAAPPLLLRDPSLSADKIAFLYADDVWTVSRQGGEARRLTSVNAVMEGPYFSPDGTRIVYSTLEHGLTDVYVVSAEGGIPQRLTWEPVSYTHLDVYKRQSRYSATATTGSIEACARCGA